jgi:hypothetical protein
MNLAETQIAVKRLLAIFVVLTITYYAGRFMIVGGINLYRTFNPVKLPPPESKWGLLPQLKMKQVQIEGDPKYILDTQNGDLPKFPDRLKVYPLIKAQSNLMSEDKVKTLASDLQFTGDPNKLSNSVLRWVDGANERTLQADIVSKNFILETPAPRISNIIAGTPSINSDDAIKTVDGFLNSKIFLSPTDLKNLAYETVPTQVNLGQIREAKNVTSSAKLMKVNVYIQVPNAKKSAKDPDIKYRILGPNPRDSLISFTVTNSEPPVYKYPLINFTYWEPDYASGSEYYISPIQDVWTAIQNGAGIISYVRTRNGDYYVPVDRLGLSKIEIRDVYLAYYMSPEYSDYLQPIYVFQGQLTTSESNGSDLGDIYIYFPAVRGDYIQK